MRRILVALTAGVIAVPAAGIVACDSVEVATAGASVYATKGAPSAVPMTESTETPRTWSQRPAS